MNDPDDAVLAMLRRAGLAGPGETPRAEPLMGGVASDIWRVDLAQGPVCVKRARLRLRVARDWRVPTERNAFEAAWLEAAAAIVPGSAPRVLAHDPGAQMFAMEYLDPARFRPWKADLLDGKADAAFAAAVGETLATLHAVSGADGAMAARFATDALFHAIRLSPYLEAAADAHPSLAGPLKALIEITAATRTALVHGDVSPKNIAAGPGGPVFFDAECAWWGDPAFDLAFVLNHMLLKCLARPDRSAAYLECFRALAGAYLGAVEVRRAPEPANDIEARAAALLPGLLLARVDGKSPVEYVTEDRDKDRVRRAAGALLSDPVKRLNDVAGAWAEELARP